MTPLGISEETPSPLLVNRGIPSPSSRVKENSAEFTQQYSTADDFESGGTTLSFAPGQENACDQSVQQASNASS